MKKPPKHKLCTYCDTRKALSFFPDPQATKCLECLKKIARRDDPRMATGPQIDVLRRAVYEPGKNPTYVRNDGLKHIKSKGVLC